MNWELIRYWSALAATLGAVLIAGWLDLQRIHARTVADCRAGDAPRAAAARESTEASSFRTGTPVSIYRRLP